MGKAKYYSAEVKLRKVINTAIWKTSLSSADKERYFEVNKNTEPKVAAREILVALKAHISSESRAEIFSAVQNVKSEEGKKSEAQIKLKAELLTVEKGQFQWVPQQAILSTCRQDTASNRPQRMY